MKRVLSSIIVLFAAVLFLKIDGASFEVYNPSEAQLNEVRTVITPSQLSLRALSNIPKPSEGKAVRTFVAEVSAYSSEVGQTDDSPFITALGTRVRKGIIANNCLSMGTKVEIGGAIYVVEDRMNRRYGCEHFDIWFADTAEAWEFGRQQLKLSVI